MEAGGANAEGKPFSFPESNIGELGADFVAELISATTDIALVLDDAGVSLDISLVCVTSHAVNDWYGRHRLAGTT